MAWEGFGEENFSGSDFGNMEIVSGYNPGYGGGNSGSSLQVFSGDELGDEMGDEMGADLRDLVSGLEIGAAPRRGQQQRRPANAQQAIAMILQAQQRQGQQIAQLAQAMKAIGQGREVYRPVGGGPQIIDTPNRRKRELFVGATSQGNIAAGASQTITIMPQVPFRVDRLVVANSISAFFDLVDVKVGKDSQLVSAGRVPAETFSNISVGVALRGDAAYPGIAISIEVVNIDAAPHQFRGSLIGFSLV